jgi:hypothetical protein
MGVNRISTMREPSHCAICGELGHNRQLHNEALTRGEQAGKLVYDQGLTFAEAARRIGITRQGAHQGWRRYVLRRDLQARGICKSG